MRSKFIYLYLESSICQSVNLSWKVAVQDAGCVFAYFCDGHKNNCWLQFCSSFNSLLFMWLFREGSVILIKYASKVFRLKVFLWTNYDNEHWNSWLKCPWGCLIHSEFLSVSLLCSFYFMLTLCIVSPV